MVFDVSVAITWVLFLALFPISFFWLRRAWRILVHRDFSEVALKRGEPPVHAERYAPYEMAINLVCGTIIAATVVFILLGELAYETWSAIAGTTIWTKFFLSFALGRYAHMQQAQVAAATASSGSGGVGAQESGDASRRG